MSRRAWWQDGLLLLGAALLLVGLGAIVGGALESKQAAKRAAALAVQSDSARAEWYRAVARLAVDVENRETLRLAAEARAKAAEGKAGVAARETATIRQELAAAVTAADSLATYPPLVDALTRQVVALDSSRTAYRDALAASVEASGVLRARIAVDSLALHDARRALAKAITVTPDKPSRWACVAGITVATGIRTGAGVGFTCGRRV
jgi:F0F1-type ATP synthase membrane subunit c/vacuolar-type H+-ATPase subunit K